MNVRQAWQRFKEKMDALRKRRAEILGRFSKRAETEQIRKIREQMNNDVS